MQLLNLSLPTPAENLALDEALIETAESEDGFPEVLRFWEANQICVILGRGSPYQSEVNHSYCAENQIPIVRRCSGGATVVGGPGCLMYSLLLDYAKRPELRMLDVAHRFVMNSMVAAIGRLSVEVVMKGTCDLVLHGRKVSGNALRCKRNHLLYHGTLLLDFPLDQIESCLEMPQRQPEYRQKRSHKEFVGQMPLEAEALKEAICETWSVRESLKKWPRDLTARLTKEKYLEPSWTQKT